MPVGQVFGNSIDTMLSIESTQVEMVVCFNACLSISSHSILMVCCLDIVEDKTKREHISAFHHFSLRLLLYGGKINELAQ